MRTVTRTVVFTDLAGYTASVSRADREGLRDLIVKHEAYVTPIVERHGGRIQSSYEPGQGAVFGIDLPLEAPEMSEDPDAFT